MSAGRSILHWLVCALVLALTALGCSDKLGFGGSSSSKAGDDPGAPPIPSVLTQSGPPRAPLVEVSNRPLSFAPIVNAADASVATVRAIYREADPRGRDRTKAEGFGTAFVYDPAGYLLTNHHVIDKADEITIGFKDGKQLPARVVGSDKRTDVAVLKVEATGLPALPLGDSDEIVVGDWVVAIGNPFGLAHTVSAGILSAKGRTSDDVKGLDPTGYFDFLQTDASINPGNSGGPLLNLKGEVVGINAAIRANANSIGFAIPVNMVKQLLPLLLRDGKIRRSALGVIVAELSGDQAGRLGKPGTRGAWVKAIQGSGPAASAGIQVDDVIVGFDGKSIEDPNALRWYASIFGVGRTATVKVVRGAKELDVRVTLGELPEQDQ
jgi:serine protease Do